MNLKNMKWIHRLGAGVLGAAALGAATAPTTMPAAATPQRAAAVKARPLVIPHGSWTQYEVLFRQNIFTRGGDSGGDAESEGRRNNRDGGGGGGHSLFSPPPAAGEWVLRGTILVSGDRVAFLENTQTGANMQAHAGDVIGGMKLVRVEPAGVDVQAGDKTQRIMVGTQLDGSAAPTTMPATASDSSGTDTNAATATGDKPSTNTVGSAADILERLRARRRQELSK